MYFKKINWGTSKKKTLKSPSGTYLQATKTKSLLKGVHAASFPNGSSAQHLRLVLFC